MKVTAEVDKKMLEDVQKRLGEFHKKAPNAISRALNEAMRGMRTNVAKSTSSEYTMSAAQIKRTMTQHKASRGNLAAQIRSSGSPNPLDQFKIRPGTINPKRKSNLKVSIFKGKTSELPGAFLTPARGKTLLARKGKERLPTEMIFGPSTPQMIGNKKVMNPAQEEAQKRFEERLDHHIKYYLSKGQGGAKK